MKTRLILTATFVYYPARLYFARYYREGHITCAGYTATFEPRKGIMEFMGTDGTKALLRVHRVASRMLPEFIDPTG